MSACETVTTGSQPQSCAACSQPTVDPHVACWVCVEKAVNFAGQLDEAAADHETALLVRNADRVSRVRLIGLFSAYPHLPVRTVLEISLRGEETR